MKKLATYWPIILVIALFAAYTWLLLESGMRHDFSNPEHGGVFGDAFGVLTSLFNGLAFAGLLIALKLQREDLALQRKELQLQRQELADTRRVMQEQEAQMRLSAEAAQRQIFESTLFALLTSLREHIQTIRYQAGTANPIYEGRDAIAFYVDRLFMSENGQFASMARGDFAAAIYARWVESMDALQSYVENLLSILDFVENSDRPNKPFYVDLLRATFSRPEKTLLFYHGLSVAPHVRLKKYIEHYGLFRDLDIVNLTRNGNDWVRHAYHPAAFGEWPDSLPRP